MADYTRIIPFILKAEGGLSNDPTDTASQNPVPDGSGYHTNKGVTWSTFSGLAKELGYVATAKLFYQMPQNIWGLIFKRGYWDKVKGDQIKSQAVAETLADFAWGSGPSRAIKTLQTVLQTGLNRKEVVVDGIIGPKTIAATNQVDEKQLFEQLTAARKAFLSNIIANNPTQKKFERGWFNRVNELYEKNKGLIKTVAFSYVGLILVTSLAIGTIALINHYSKKEKQITNGTTV